MKKKLNYIIFIVLIILNLIFIIYSFYQTKNYSYIIFDENNIWKFNNNTVKSVARHNIKRLSYTYSNIYNNDEYNGYYSKDDNLKIYFESLELSERGSNSLILIGNHKIKDYTSLLTNDIDEEDETVVKEWLLKNNINMSITDIYITKAKITRSKSIYSIEPYVLNGVMENGFSYTFMYDDGEYSLIYKKPSDSKDNRSSTLRNIIDIDNDGNLEVIFLSDIPGSAGNECYSLYKYNESSRIYKPEIDCED